MKNKIYRIACTVLAALSLSGCSGTELENKSFPLAVLVSAQEEQYKVCYLAQQLSEVSNERADGGNMTAAGASGSTYYETHKTFEKNNRCQLDMSHTKAIIFQKDFIDSGALLSFLETARNENTYARNTLVYLTDSKMEQLEELNSTLEIPLGSYLEQMMENEQDSKEQAAVTLGALLNEQQNASRTLLLPVLQVENGQPVIHAYEAMQDFVPKGRVGMEEALIHYLLAGQLDQMDLDFGDGVQVKLSGFQCRRDFGLDRESGKITEQLTVAAKAWNVTGQASRDDIEKLLQGKIEEACRGSKKENGIDLSDSRRFLALYAPEIYRLYGNRAEEYRRDLDYKAKVRIWQQ